MTLPDHRHLNPNLVRLHAAVGCAITASAAVCGVPFLHGASSLADEIIAGEPCELQKLLASDGVEFDEFGFSVEFSNGVAIVGATAYDVEVGAAYIFRFDGSAWVEEEVLAAQPGVGREFGYDVAIDGDRAIVMGRGLTWGTGPTTWAYTYDGACWGPPQQLFDMWGSSQTAFSVAVTGAGAFIGTFNNQQPPPVAAGWVQRYVYDPGLGVWNHVDTLYASDAQEHDGLGRSIAATADQLHRSAAVLAGAPYGDGGNGAAYVFRAGDPWYEEQKLTASDGALGDLFGDTVDITGDLIIVGAPNDNGGAGAAYVFRYDGTGWIEEQKLVASDGAPNQGFGMPVAIEGDVALVGKFSDDDWTGAVYLFRYDGGTWIEANKFRASDSCEGDHFGNSISLRGDIAFIGAPNDDDNGGESGSVYVFDLSCQHECPADVTGDGTVDVLDLLLVLAAWGNTSGAEDINGDGIVNVLDMLEVLGQWGPCP